MIAQLRYYNEEDSFPIGVNKDNLQSGEVFESYLPITQLTIQTLPEIKFYINDNPILIDPSGMFKVNLDGISEITKLSFDSESLDRIKENENASLIIDIIFNQN